MVDANVRQIVGDARGCCHRTTLSSRTKRALGRGDAPTNIYLNRGPAARCGFAALNPLGSFVYYVTAARLVFGDARFLPPPGFNAAQIPTDQRPRQARVCATS